MTSFIDERTLISFAIQLDVSAGLPGPKKAKVVHKQFQKGPNLAYLTFKGRSETMFGYGLQDSAVFCASLSSLLSFRVHVQFHLVLAKFS